jgi:hypothetical protein
MDIHPAYRVRVELLGADARHEGSLAPAAGLILVSAGREGVTLEALVQGVTHQVVAAAFRGATTGEQRGLIESLCRVMEGRPIQDCADHAAIAVERAVRDPAEAPPVRGLLTPENADPSFALVQSLVRDLRTEYARKTGFTSTVNFFDAQPSEAWRRLSDDQRMEKLGEAIGKGGWGERLRLLGIQDRKRVVVGFAEDAGSGEQQQVLIQLEELLRREVEPTLQLLMQAKSDTNVVRLPTNRKTT